MDVFGVIGFAISYLIAVGLSGALFGLIPFLVGKYSGKPNLGMLGFKWTIGANLLLGVGFPVAIGFLVAIIVKDRDYYPVTPVSSGGYYGGSPAPAPAPAPAPQPAMNSHLGITCLNGPMRGQTYRVGPQGMIIGRDHDCAIRFESSTPGISRHHCSLRWQQGVLVLTDMDSAYGTYMADGRKLPPQYPTQLAAGSRFYLANVGYLFQVVITG